MLFPTIYCTIRNRILHGKSAYSVHTACSYIEQNVRQITGVLSKDIEAILPCIALDLQPKSSRTLHFPLNICLKMLFQQYFVL